MTSVNIEFKKCIEDSTSAVNILDRLLEWGNKYNNRDVIDMVIEMKKLSPCDLYKILVEYCKNNSIQIASLDD